MKFREAIKPTKVKLFASAVATILPIWWLSSIHACLQILQYPPPSGFNYSFADPFSCGHTSLGELMTRYSLIIALFLFVYIFLSLAQYFIYRGLTPRE